MKLLKFAAIDIGSNAVRLLFTNVIENKNKTVFKKSSLIRMPVRLGEEVFSNNVISNKMQEKLIQTMKAFSYLMKVEDVVSCRACATSAMREASNGAELVEKIKKETGIGIQIIDGKEEADIIFSNSISNKIAVSNNYLFVDVGGGSTEITLFSGGKVEQSHSFNIGTIRLMKKKVKKSEKDYMKKWLKDLSGKYNDLVIIGSGGNINRYFKISRKKEGKPLSYYHLLEMYDMISSFSYNDRIKVLGFNPDRADVIIPAGEVFLNIMKWTNVKQIYVPKIGLSDGIVKQLYKEYVNEKNNGTNN